MTSGEQNKAKRILVVEDEALVAMLIDDVLTDHGFEVVGPANNVAQALELVGDGSLDAAVLDVNLGNGQTSYGIADNLAARGVPFLFLTGYGNAGMEKRYADWPLLQKPFDPERLIVVLSRQLPSETKSPVE